MGGKSVILLEMIKRLEAKYIDDVAVAQRIAWQRAFRGILSDPLLNALEDSEFVNNWKRIIKRMDRTNLAKITLEEKAVGFVSFGPPYDERETVNAEIYGIYIHPAYWNQGIGKELMIEAIGLLGKESRYNGVTLWTMTKNKKSNRFYEKIGFRRTDEQRISQRNGESFTEVKYYYDAD